MENYLILYTDNSSKSSEAKFLLDKAGFNYVEVKSKREDLPFLDNKGLFFKKGLPSSV